MVAMRRVSPLRVISITADPANVNARPAVISHSFFRKRTRNFEGYSLSRQYQLEASDSISFGFHLG